MPFLNDLIRDNGLSALTAEGNRLDLCTAEPTTYAQATSTLTLGNKVTPTISAAAARTPSGRKVTVSAVTDGTVTANGTATHYAISDTVNSRLLAANALASSLAISTGYTFTTTAIDIGIPGV